MRQHKMGQVCSPMTSKSQAQLVAASYFALLLFASFVETSSGQLPQLVSGKAPISTVERQRQWQHVSNGNLMAFNYNNPQQQYAAGLKRATQTLTPSTRPRRATETIATSNMQPNVLTIIQPQPHPSPQQAVQFRPQDALKIQDYYYPTASGSYTNPTVSLQRGSDQLSTMPADLNIRGRIWEHPSHSQESMSTPWNILPPPPTQQAREQKPSSTDGQQFEGTARDWSGASLFSSRGQARANDLDYKCKQRSFVKMLKSAKSLLTDGFASLERSATSRFAAISTHAHTCNPVEYCCNLMLGSSLLAAAIPLVVHVLPDSFRWRTATGKSTNLLDDATSPSNLIASGPRFNLQGRVDSVMGWIERSVEHLPSFPRLHPKECVKRSICEAHNEPDKYGVVGFMLRLLFPATNSSSTDRMDNMEYKVINKYRHAAGYGLARRMESANATGDGMPPPSTGACKEKYEDCLVSLLDVAQNLIDTFLA